jgi:hypothetical protein
LSVLFANATERRRFCSVPLFTSCQKHIIYK